MARAFRVGLLAAIMLLASAALFACGGGQYQVGAGASTTAQTGTTAPSGTTAPDQTTAPDATTETSTGEGAGAEVETEVSGMPAEFPADVPVHPGTVTAYEPMEITDSTTVHQLTVQTTASLDDVVEWYKSKLPSGWSVGFLEAEGGEAKIALNGGSYTPASPDGKGGGVLVGLMEGSKTTIVVTVTVMGK